MKMELTEKELRTLVNMAFICDIVTNGMTYLGEAEQDYENLINKIYSVAHNAGMTKEIIRYEDDEMYDLSDEYNQKVYKIIEQYDEEVFWEELSFRLAERDIARADKLFSSREKYMHAVWERQEKYQEEIEKYGIERLAIDTSNNVKASSNGSCSCGCDHNHNHKH